MMRPSLALLCCALMILGCSREQILSSAPGLKTQPAKKASQKVASIQEQPATGGSGAMVAGAIERRCPDVDEAAYTALAKPLPVPEAKAALGPDAVKQWVGDLDGQATELREQLRGSLGRETCLRLQAQSPKSP